MAEITSSRPLGTEVAGLSTTDDNAITVLSCKMFAGQPYWFLNGGTTDGYYKTTDDADWQPFLAGKTFNLKARYSRTLTVQVKRIPSGSNLTKVDGGVLH